MTRTVMFAIGALTLGGSALAADSDTSAHEGIVATHAHVDPEWSPPCAFNIETGLKEDAFKLRGVTFNSQMNFDGRPVVQRSENVVQSTVTMTLSFSPEALEEPQEDRRARRGRIILSPRVIEQALGWIDSDAQVDAWVKRSGVPDGSTIDVRIASGGRGSSTPTLNVNLTLDGDRVQKTVRFAGMELKAEETTKLIGFLKQARDEMNVLHTRLSEAS